MASHCLNHWWPWRPIMPNLSILNRPNWINRLDYQMYDWGYFTFGHDDIIKWKHFPRYWPLVQGIHFSLVNSPHKGQWRGALMFSLIWIWTDGWVNNRDAGDLGCYRTHYDITCYNTVQYILMSPSYLFLYPFLLQCHHRRLFMQWLLNNFCCLFHFWQDW